jgi:hypothetical protein
MFILQAAFGYIFFVFLCIIAILLILAPVLAKIIRLYLKYKEVRKFRKKGIELRYPANDDMGDIISTYLFSVAILVILFFIILNLFFSDIVFL